MQQGIQFGFATKHFAFQLDARDRVFFTFIDIDGDVDILLVGRNRNLRRFDLHLDIAAILVVGFQRFDITSEFLLRILIRLGVPGKPARCAQTQHLDQFFFAEGLAADDIDILDARDIAFIDYKIDRYTITLHRCDCRRDQHAVQTARQVLAFQFLFRAIYQCLVKNTRLANADFLQSLGQLLLVKFLGAGKFNTGNCRTLFNKYHQYVALDFDTHILEETRGIQGLDCGRAFFIRKRFAYPHRQIAENRTGFSTLYTFNADVFYSERISRLCIAGTQGKSCNSDKVTTKYRQRETL